MVSNTAPPPNPDGAACEYTQKTAARIWYWWREPPSASDPQGRRRWHAGGETGRGMRGWLERLNARAREDVVAVNKWRPQIDDLKAEPRTPGGTWYKLTRSPADAASALRCSPRGQTT